MPGDTVTSARARSATPRFDPTARRAVRSGSVWGAVFALYVVTSALGYATTYRSGAQRAQLASTLGSNVGFNALIGPARDIGTVAGFTAWRSLGVLGVVGGIWGLLLSTQLLRGEEDAGRWELLLAAPTTRRRATVHVVYALGAGLAALAAITAAGAVLVGQVDSVRIRPVPAAFLALAAVSAAAVFLAIGVLTAQLAPTRRQAAAVAAAVLGSSYAVRLIADSGTGVGWLRWLSPLGWIEELRPLSSPRPVMLVPITALVAGALVLAVHLAARRDLGASVLPDRTSTRAHTTLLGGPTGLSVRLARGVLAGWLVSITSVALIMGLIASSVGDVLAADAGDRDSYAKLGLRGSGAVQYLSVTMIVVAVLVAFLVAGQVSAMRLEESSGRTDQLFARPVSRYRWVLGRLAVTLVAVSAAGLSAGIASWAGSGSQGAGVSAISLLGAGLNVVPQAVFVLGAGTLCFGASPRAVPVVVYGLIAWSFLVEFVGTEVKASHWVLDTSLLHQMAPAPAAGPDWTSGSILLLLGLLAIAGGLVAFRHRDLVGE